MILLSFILIDLYIILGVIFKKKFYSLEIDTIHLSELLPSNIRYLLALGFLIALYIMFKVKDMNFSYMLIYIFVINALENDL